MLAASVLSVVHFGDETCCGGHQGHAVFERDSQRETPPPTVSVEDEVRCPKLGYFMDMRAVATTAPWRQEARGAAGGCG